MQRQIKELTNNFVKISDGACHAQVRGGSGIGRFICSDDAPDNADKAFLQLTDIDWPGPEALYVAAEGEPGNVIVWEDV